MSSSGGRGGNENAQIGGRGGVKPNCPVLEVVVETQLFSSGGRGGNQTAQFWREWWKPNCLVLEGEVETKMTSSGGRSGNPTV